MSAIPRAATPLTLLTILEDDEEVAAFFRISDYHGPACIEITGMDLALQLRAQPPGNARHAAVTRFVDWYKAMLASDWTTLEHQSVELIARLKRIQGL